MAAKRKTANSEVRAYIYIKQQLQAAGWDTRNPERHEDGQVYTQNECLNHPEIKRWLKLDRPENVVKISDGTYWVIEAKPEHKALDQAFKEARDDYAAQINKSKTISAKFISGVAGNDADGYLIKTAYLHKGKFVQITANGKDLSSLLTPELVSRVLNEGPELDDIPINEQQFLSTAETINEILHLGAINKNQRARVMSALLLAMVDGMPDIDKSPQVLISDINTRAKEILDNEGKGNFYPFIRLNLPPTRDNHVKYKTALVKTLQELNNINIRSAMSSGSDVLGKFYEVFLKYGNGAKEIGIVLTPRHITKFAVEALGITAKDYVLDPTCGTGGFLVAAFDHVTRNYPRAVKTFKRENLFGVEQEAEVVALALVNMIFRGDGKSNIVEGNCFNKNIVRTPEKVEYASKPPEEDDAVITKTLMNPPFALKNEDDKEYRFVDHALRQMTDGGTLFSVLPYSALVRPGGYRSWRKALLREHTLLAVVTVS